MPVLYPITRGALFRLDAETAHELVIDTMAALPGPARSLLRRVVTIADPSLRTRVCGIDFPNPVGLAAGFDKSGRSFNALGSLGFGFVEIGTVTALPQEGNPKPRVFRLPEDKALLNRMGFNNPGAERVAEHLSRERIETILGINVGKSKATPLEDAIEDYLRSISLLEAFARYLVINVSSPNTPGLRGLQDAAPLRALLKAVAARSTGNGGGGAPVFLKLAPDLTNEQLEHAVGIAVEEGIAGIIAVNTTIARNSLRTSDAEGLGGGGISGAPLRKRAHEVVRQIYLMSRGSIPIIGVGGIFTPEDAWDRICAGASLVQLYTGFIYEGPGLIARINRSLVDRLRAEGASSIAQVVGSATHP